MADNWNKRVSLVIMLIDDMTDKVITDAARVWIEGAPSCIRKSEGYYVFTDLAGEWVSVRILHGMYEQKIVEMKVPKEGEPYAMRKVRMTPGRCYRLSAGTSCVEGRAEPGSRIHLFCKQGEKGLKLLYDYGGKTEKYISIYHPADMQLEGKLLRIVEKNKRSAETFRILSKEGDRYILEEPLQRAYKKMETTIYPIFEAQTDAEGRFFLPVCKVSTSSMDFCCQALGSGKEPVQCDITLEKGAVVKVNLLELSRSDWEIQGSPIGGK